MRKLNSLILTEQEETKTKYFAPKNKLKKVSGSAHSAKKIGCRNPWSMSLLITTMNKMKKDIATNSE